MAFYVCTHVYAQICTYDKSQQKLEFFHTCTRMCNHAHVLYCPSSRFLQESSARNLMFIHQYYVQVPSFTISISSFQSFLSGRKWDSFGFKQSLAVVTEVADSGSSFAFVCGAFLVITSSTAYKGKVNLIDEMSSFNSVNYVKIGMNNLNVLRSAFAMWTQHVVPLTFMIMCGSLFNGEKSRNITELITLYFTSPAKSATNHRR